MAKKIVAVTGIRHNGDEFPAGETVDAAKFNKDELKALHDNGAIVIVDDTKIDEVKAEDLTPEDLGQKGAQMMDVSAESKQGTADLINKATGAKPDSGPAKTAAEPAKETPVKK